MARQGDRPERGLLGAATATSRRVRVLVVADDDRGASIRSALEVTPEPLAATVETEGKRALERIAAGWVDCIICAGRFCARDGEWHGSGCSLLEEIRDRWPRLPFVLVADGNGVDPKVALEAGATDYVRPPLADEQVRVVARRVRNYGERYVSERQLQIRRAGHDDGPTAGVSGDASRLGPDRASVSTDDADSDGGGDDDGDDSEDDTHSRGDQDDTHSRGDHRARGNGRGSRMTLAELRAFSAVFPDIALLVTESGRYLDVAAGPNTDSLLTDDPDAFVGQTVFETVPSEQASTLMDRIDDALETETVQTCRYQLDVPAGQRWFEARIAPFEDRVDGERLVIVVVRDVTDHKETELKLRQQESYLTQAQAIADLGSWRIELPTEDIEWSEEVYRIFGISTDESITTERFREQVHPDDRDRVAQAWEAALEGAPLDVEHRIVVDGETRWVRQKAEFTFDDETPIEAVGVVQDITDHKRHEQQLEFQNQQLEVFNRIIRHDLRNQLNIVAGYASLLEEDSMDGASVADQIREATNELLQVSEDIREVNRLISDGSDHRPIQLATLIGDVLVSVHDAYSDYEFECETSIAESLWVFERNGLKIALENVVENAIEHNDAACPRVEITAEECSDSTAVEVRIADNGPGIPETEREILTGGRERTQLEHTSGLGLWTVNWIVTAIGGDLGFETADDGTVVRIRLPRAESPAQRLQP